ncbi:MAG: hypothetical protein KKE17_00585 [Proteobacteria bacterium]|nr:hypothetical protein [Pseudomonadota bacterium]MBU1708478.1 hypothetical protein [Pseudomonadota bacterium]
MNYKYSPENQIHLPQKIYNTIIEHCRKKLSPGSDQEEKHNDYKAFGLLAGIIKDKKIQIQQCYPLYKNARSAGPYKNYMDDIMAKHAMPSITPLEKRGWVAEPEELLEKIHSCKRKNIIMLGTYHMHRVAWDHDKLRDTPTNLDTVLAEKSGLVMFIISMTEPQKPIIRAFHEGNKDKEIAISII